MEKNVNIPEEQSQNIILVESIVPRPQGETEDPEPVVKPGEDLPEN